MNDLNKIRGLLGALTNVYPTTVSTERHQEILDETAKKIGVLLAQAHREGARALYNRVTERISVKVPPEVDLTTHDKLIDILREEMDKGFKE